MRPANRDNLSVMPNDGKDNKTDVTSDITTDITTDEEPVESNDEPINPTDESSDKSVDETEDDMTDNVADNCDVTNDGTDDGTTEPSERHDGERKESLLSRLRPSLAYLLNPFSNTTRSIKKPLIIMILSGILATVIAIVVGISVANYLFEAVSIFESEPESAQTAVTATQFYASMGTELTSWTACVSGFINNLSGILLLIFAAILMLLLRDRRPGTVMSCEGRFRWRVALMVWPALIPLAAVAAIPLIEHHEDISLANIDPLRTLIYLSYMGISIALEDLICRGYLRQTMFAWIGNRKRLRNSLYGQRTAMIISSILATLLFTTAHPYDIVGLASVMLFGLLSCWVTDLTGGLEIPILVHIGWDFSCIVAAAILPNVPIISTATGILSETIQDIVLTVLVFVLPALLYAHRRRDHADDALVTVVPDVPPTNKQQKTRRTLVVMTSVASVIGLLASFVVNHVTHISSEAMEPIIYANDLYLYETQEAYEVGDVVEVCRIEFHESDESPEISVYIRQIKGCEGDTVTVDGKKVKLGKDEYLVKSANPSANYGNECHNVIVDVTDINGKLAYRLLPSFEKVGD